MSNRRSFIKGSVAGVVLAGLAPSVSVMAVTGHDNGATSGRKPKLRFAIASDGHYGQPGTDYKKDHENIVRWLNEAHAKSPLNFVIINGDLVHDRPDLLAVVKKEHYDHLRVPFYAIPGNHDHADAAIWKSVFGYEDNFSFEKNDIGFVLANTSDTAGKYLCPNNDFLKQELDKFKELKAVFVVLHIPPHFWVPESPFVECPDTIKLLHSYPNVKAVFHGHDHSLDAVFYTNKLPHFFDAHIGGNWGTSYRGYRIVEVDDENKISTYQVNASAHPLLNETKF
ncbi:MAG TPA: metallophosphoesterase [Pedobacter sp.]|uniref:metallophosphoesterase family protein n=1 Tax=Pedobacter sp. TaxID=1411316 RepID=UPI002B56ACA5|nr:metallophosphoesterase [Pedobacter sp.]HMI04952.1 metallophosphoesterase [Pedobacter sp.]